MKLWRSSATEICASNVLEQQCTIGHNKKTTTSLIGLVRQCQATKILKIWPKLRALWPWQWKYPEQLTEEPTICSFFQGAKKRPFWQNQVLPMALGYGPRWCWQISCFASHVSYLVISSRKLRVLAVSKEYWLVFKKHQTPEWLSAI